MLCMSAAYAAMWCVVQEQERVLTMKTKLINNSRMRDIINLCTLRCDVVGNGAKQTKGSVIEKRIDPFDWYQSINQSVLAARGAGQIAVEYSSYNKGQKQS